MATMPEPTIPSPLNRDASNGVLLHDRVEDRPELPPGTFARLPDGTLLCIARRERNRPFTL
mgnify:CR=1 FL=1